MEPVWALFPKLSSKFLKTCLPLPPIMCEGLVGFGHAMDIFLLLDRCSASVRGVEQLVGQLINHAFFAASTAISDDPPDGQRSTAIGIDFDRNLIVGATDV